MFFWDGSGAELFNMFSNASLDAIISAYCGWFLFKEVDFNKGKRSNYLRSALSGALILSISIALLYILHYAVYSLSNSLDGRFAETFSLFSFQIFDLLTVLFIGTTLSIAFLKNQSLKDREQRIKSLEEERKKAEIAFLRSQMDPHFIFNTLNAILYQVDEKNTEAQDTIIKFSDLIRFHLCDFQEDFIPIEKEISFIRSYIDIMKIRKNEYLDIQLHIDKNLDSVCIPPLLIIPIIENCFKHAGNQLEKKSLIDIQLIVENGFLRLTASNPIKKQTSRDKEIKGPGGIGLKNIEKRLELHFKDQYELKTSDDGENFQIQLKVPIRNESFYT